MSSPELHGVVVQTVAGNGLKAIETLFQLVMAGLISGSGGAPLMHGPALKGMALGEMFACCANGNYQIRCHRAPPLTKTKCNTLLRTCSRSFASSTIEGMRKKKYPSDISREQFEQLRGLLESASEENQTAHGRFVRGILCSALPSQKRLPVAHAARGISEVANGPFLLHQMKQTRPERYQRAGAGFKKIRLVRPYQTGTRRHDELLDR